MNAFNAGTFRSLSRITLAAIVLGLGAAPTLGCDSANEPDHSLRADVAAIRGAHGDPDAIGALDATAPPPDLNEYRKPVYRTAATR